MEKLAKPAVVVEEELGQEEGNDRRYRLWTVDWKEARVAIVKELIRAAIMVCYGWRGYARKWEGKE